MTDPSVEQQLKEYLEWHNKERREGKTLEAVLAAVKRVADAQVEDHAVLLRHGRAIKTLQQQVGNLTRVTPTVPDWQPAKEETTGVHELRAIQKAHEALQAKLAAEETRKIENATWWSRQRWLWAAAFVLAFLGTMVTGCVGYVAYRIQTLEKHIEKH